MAVTEVGAGALKSLSSAEESKAPTSEILSKANDFVEVFVCRPSARRGRYVHEVGLVQFAVLQR